MNQMLNDYLEIGIKNFINYDCNKQHTLKIFHICCPNDGAGAGDDDDNDDYDDMITKYNHPWNAKREKERNKKKKKIIWKCASSLTSIKNRKNVQRKQTDK